MQRARVIKDFLSCIKHNDVVMFSGEDISKEAYQYDRDGNFYILDKNNITPSLALGVAMCTDKRVFVFSGDGAFMSDIGSYAQAAVSKCKNIFNIVLDNGCYQAAGGHPTIFREMPAPKGIAFDMGYLTYDFTTSFSRRISVPKTTKMINNLVGPAFILIKVDKGYKKGINNIDISKIDFKDRISNFIRNREIGSSLYNQPFLV